MISIVMAMVIIVIFVLVMMIMRIDLMVVTAIRPKKRHSEWSETINTVAIVVLEIYYSVANANFYYHSAIFCV